MSYKQGRDFTGNWRPRSWPEGGGTGTRSTRCPCPWTKGRPLSSLAPTFPRPPSGGETPLARRRGEPGPLAGAADPPYRAAHPLRQVRLRRHLSDRGGREVAGSLLRVVAGTVGRVFPGDAVISFVTPDKAAVEQTPGQVSSGHQRVFDNADAATSRLAEDVVRLTPAPARRLGAARNRTVFGDSLAPELP